jgi:hypothetical protein
MATTSKSGKKAGKKAGSSKASKASKAAVAGDSDVEHPPVIITDGSATIALDENEYRRTPPMTGNRHVSTGLRLLSVGANRLHDETKSQICHTLDDDEVVEIRVTTRVGGGPHQRSFTITGGNAEDGSQSPVVEFDHGIFPAGNVVASRRRFRNANRQIVSLEIFSPPGSAQPVHTCSVVANLSNYEITFFDDHVDD